MKKPKDRSLLTDHDIMEEIFILQEKRSKQRMPYIPYSQRSAESKKAQEKWKKENVSRVVMNLNCRTDADILDRLDNISEGKMTYIKRLIREDIARSQAEPT